MIEAKRLCQARGAPVGADDKCSCKTASLAGIDSYPAVFRAGADDIVGIIYIGMMLPGFLKKTFEQGLLVVGGADAARFAPVRVCSIIAELYFMALVRVD